MASNTIVLRVFEFLNEFPPFNKLEKEELMDLSEKVVIRYFNKDDYVFRQHDPPGEFFYINKSGSVELTRTDESSDVLVDVCDEGDIFGVRSMISGLPYILNARVKEESLLYAIPIADFKPYLEENTKVSLFFVSGLAAGQINSEYMHQRDFGALADRDVSTGESERIDLQSVVNMEQKELITCSPDTMIREAAILMTEKHVGSIIICDAQQRPQGIVTDTDLRTKVVTGDFSRENQIGQIMASPVITIHKNSSVIDILLIMLTRNVHHLCITEDGTDQSRAIGIVSQRDLTVMQGNSPLLLFREIKRARGVNELADIRNNAEKLVEKYLGQEVSVRFVSKLITAINDAIIRKALRLAEDQMSEEGRLHPGLNYCWLALGSEGREEQLLRTDLDNAFLYEDPPENKKQHATGYFLELGKRTTEILIKCGFEKCPSDMMASNEKWNAPLSTWKGYFSKWIETPEPMALMLSTIFFDYRHVAGDERLVKDLDDFLISMITKNKIFLNFFAQNATQNPAPLSFFRGFVLERNGEHKNEFDIKLRAMMPLVDAARVLCLEKQLLEEKNTLKRYDRLGQAEPNNANLYKNAAKAYEILMNMRARQGLKNNNSGRFLPVEDLSKLDRQVLKKAFAPIEQLQKLLRTRFQLDYFN
jgi:CBS domain-containing protein